MIYSMIYIKIYVFLDLKVLLGALKTGFLFVFCTLSLVKISVVRMDFVCKKLVIVLMILLVKIVLFSVQRKIQMIKINML